MIWVCKFFDRVYDSKVARILQGGSLGVCGFDGSHPKIVVRVEVLSGLVKQAAKKQLSTKTTLLLVASAANSHLQPNLV
jgi:hypothetical protein